jgi:branched-chain amino acid aminotransferase
MEGLMAQLANQRVAYFNGRIVPEADVRISFRDRGFKYGDAAFDTTRSFGHRIFKLAEHLDRFYRSLRYLRLDPGMSKEEMARVSEEVFERNRHLLAPDEDYWLSQRVSRGADPGYGVETGPTVIVECAPLPLDARARLFRDGIDVVVPSVRRTSPSALSPRAKMHNYLNMVVADFEAKNASPDAWAVLLDENGNLAEGQGSNIFLVRDGRLLTPRERYVLPGVSRQTVIDLAAGLGVPVEEKDLDLYDAAVADEIFLTSTSLCICPVASLNGGRVGDGKVPGPLTKRLSDAYAEFVGFDFVGQYLKRLKG